MDRFKHLPLRIRLVAGFALAMLFVLSGAGVFVYWRVEFALDRRLNADLTSQATDIRRSLLGRSPTAAIEALGDEGRDAQVLARDGRVLAEGSDLAGHPSLLTPSELRRAITSPLLANRGNLFSGRGRHFRVQAVPLLAGQPTTNPTMTAPVAIVAAARLDQRDEALDELLVQLAAANLVALAIASLVGYRLTAAALTPVERYRQRAEAIAAGATGLRLDVPEGADDEVTRLGITLNYMLVSLETSAAKQQQFIDDASHELRTPLTVLAAEIDIALRRPRSNEDLEATLRRLSTEIALVIDLANDLLTLGANGIDTSRATSTDVTALLEAAARRARGQLDDDYHRPVYVDAAQPMTVQADTALLNRALGNLVDNAVKYGAGGTTLDARYATSGNADFVVLSVADEGAGMSEEFLPHAAERFRRADQARQSAGTGLGLSLVDAIVTAHHGQLRLCANDHHYLLTSEDARLNTIACSHPHTGTTASVVLPVAAPPPSPHAT